MPMVRDVAKGNPSLDISARVTASRIVRDFGPISDSTALAEVMSNNWAFSP